MGHDDLITKFNCLNAWAFRVASMIYVKPAHFVFVLSRELASSVATPFSLSNLEKGVATPEANSLLNTINKMNRLYTIDATLPYLSIAEIRWRPLGFSSQAINNFLIKKTTPDGFIVVTLFCLEVCLGAEIYVFYYEILDPAGSGS